MPANHETIHNLKAIEEKQVRKQKNRISRVNNLYLRSYIQFRFYLNIFRKPDDNSFRVLIVGKPNW